MKRAVFIVWVNNKEKIIAVGFTKEQARQIFRNARSIVATFEQKANI